MTMVMKIYFQDKFKALANENDTLIVYTTSGKSKNIIKSVIEARQRLKSIISLTGPLSDELADFQMQFYQ